MLSLRTIAMATCTLCASAAPRAASAQSDLGLSLTASVLTAHVLGLGVDYQIAAPLALIARAEGIGREQAAGLGVRLIPFTSDTGMEVYGTGMAGVLRCRNILFGGCSEEGTSFSIAGGAGISFDVSARWSAGVETVYWHSPRYDPSRAEAGQESRLTLSGVFRFRL